ncbi:MAG: hypothetical protein OEY59_05455 [Deltaproteobacteria bacterium]|nr:hypothetical protein [Deltaproteobacteria bacterium]
MIRAPLIFWIFIFLSILSACDGVEKDQAPKKQSVEETFRLGGAPVWVKVRLQSDEIELIDYQKMEIEIQYSEEVELVPFYLSEEVISPLTLVERPRERETWLIKASLQQLIISYVMEAYQSGEFQIRPFKVYFRLKNERPKPGEDQPVYQIETKPLIFKVNPSKDLGGDIRGLKGFILPAFKWGYLGLSLVGVALIFILAYFFMRSIRSAGDSETAPIAKIDHYLLAMKKLEELKALGLLEAGEFERLYTELSDILRSFIENRLHIKAQEQTTEEFTAGLASSDFFGSEQKMFLKQFLSLADLVKFATYDPGDEASWEAMAAVKGFVESIGGDYGI